MTDRLFDLTDLPEPDPVEKISAERRRTMRQHAALERGEHPLMGGLLRQRPGETCGTCDHHVIQGGTSGRYHKCALRNTGGPATDIRVSWPGCYRWEQEE